MKAIVGLGNPGKQYEGTRHNVGFAVLDELQRRAGTREWDVGPGGVNALLATWRPPGGDTVVLAKPLTFMNLSGDAVGALVRYYKIELADLLVIVDEVQLPLGRLRVRPNGSAGGHNGLKSLVAHLGDAFPRLRVGVGRGDPSWDLADHVLSRFAKDERALVSEMVTRAADAAETFVREGIDMTMNRFNAPTEAKTE